MAQLENFRLKVFRTVAEHLSFHKAAEHLFLTQPAVTQQVKAPEDELGKTLRREHDAPPTDVIESF
jgi:DNA-binding transcriptional LysR family regulator